MKKNIEIIAMIYKSLGFLDFITDQLKSPKCKANGWDVGVRVVANDASEKVVNRLKAGDIPYSIYNDPKPEDFYLNRVYRCSNYGAQSSEYDNICFVNSDMAFTEGWLENLLKHHDGVNIPCSRLVESGRIPVATTRHGVPQNFGTTPKEFNQLALETFAKEISEDRTESSGLFMPCVFEKLKFITAVMYPEGNIFYAAGDSFEVGRPNDVTPYASGDAFFFNDILKKRFGMKHITAFDSIVYHIQEGEKAE